MPRLERWGRASAVAAALVACVLPGCRRQVPEERPAGYDLVSLWELVRARGETAAIELGTAAAREFLAEGWSWDERDGGGTFVWGVGPRSAVRFHLTEARDLTLVLRVAGASGPAGERQTVSVAVNGQPLGRLRLEPTAAEYRLALPASAGRPGWNRLELAYRHHRPGPRIRQLAARWESIRFGEPRPDAAARADAAAGTLSIPCRAQVEYTLRLPAGAALDVAELVAGGDGGGSLEVLLEPEGGDEAALARLRPGRDLRLELGEAAGGVSRLTLRAVGECGAGGLVASRPRVALAAGREGPPPATPRTNVIVYLIDALRADRVGAYGGPLGLTPEIDEFAEDAVVFRDAFAQSSWTKPAVASLFTGLLPTSHGVLLRRQALSSRATTLAEALLASGYRTAAFSTNPFVSRSFGLDQGFLDFDYLGAADGGAGHALSDQVHEEVVRWLDAEPGEPFFLYLHTLDPHAPYAPERPDGTVERGEEPAPMPSCAEQRPLAEEARRRLVRRYEEEIAFNDASFGRLIDELRARGLYEDSIIVLVSDHGEAFWEHRGWRHENFLYSEVIRIPLIVRPPGGAGGEIRSGPAQQIDVLPTILGLLRLPVPAGVDGRGLLGSGGGEAPRAAYSYLECPSGKRFAAVVAGPWKLIRTTGPRRAAERLELYHRQRDPGELENLAAAEPDVTRRLRALLDARAEGRSLTADRVEVGEEIRQALGALGYID